MTAISQHRRSWVWTLSVLLASTIFLALLGWREADRAQGTADLLMSDYASFIANGFFQEASERFSHETGLSYSPDHIHDNQPSAVSWLRNWLIASERGPLTSAPPAEIVKYYFSYDPGSRELETSRANQLSTAERSELLQALTQLPRSCPASTIVPFPSIGTRTAETQLDWTALVMTNAGGKPQFIGGFRSNRSALLKKLLIPLIHNEECRCPPRMVPESLGPVEDLREVASFILRDQSGRVQYQSVPQYPAGRAVTKAFPATLPFAGWTLEVRLNPESLRPLLPYGGRGIPWPAVLLVSLLAASAGVISISAQRRYREALKLREDFVANVSHELKTPLARVRLYNDLLRRDHPIENETRGRYRQIIDRECRRLGMLVDNVLDFARLERGVSGQRIRFDLKETTEEAVESFRAASNPERFVLKSELNGPLPVEGDRDALHQVVTNLLDNALKYGGTGCCIKVRLASRGDHAILSVSDDGPGIPAPDRPRIFEAFYRAASAEEAAISGSGLGLSLVKATVESHAGQISVSCDPQSGTCFVVELPLARADEAEL